MNPFGFPKVILLVDAIAFLCVGACFLVTPGWLMPKVGLEAASGTALADVRAVYGGLDAGLGLFLLLCLKNAWTAQGLWCATIVFAALAAGRTIGVFADAPHTSMTYGLLSTELAGLVLSAIALGYARNGSQRSEDSF